MKQYSFLLEDYKLLEEKLDKMTIAGILASLGLIASPAIKMPASVKAKTGAENLAQAIILQLKKQPKHVDYAKEFERGANAAYNFMLSSSPAAKQAAEASKLGQDIIDTIKRKSHTNFTDNVRKVIQGE